MDARIFFSRVPTYNFPEICFRGATTVRTPFDKNGRKTLICEPGRRSARRAFDSVMKRRQESACESRGVNETRDGVFSYAGNILDLAATRRRRAGKK